MSRRISHLYCILVVPWLAWGGPITNPDNSLILANGVVLQNAVLKQVTNHGVVIAHHDGDNRALSSIPFYQLPTELREDTLEAKKSLKEQENSFQNREPLENEYLANRKAEIAANREAERQASIVAAREPSKSREAHSGNNPTWNDMEVMSAEFGLRHGIVRVHNHGRTSRRLESWDFRIVYTDGSTRTPNLLRPNRLPAGAVSEVSFRVPDLRYRIPRFIQFSRGDDTLLAVDRNVVEVDFVSPPRRPHYRNVIRRGGGPPASIRSHIPVRRQPHQRR